MLVQSQKQSCKKALAALIATAPPEMRPACIALLRAAHSALAAGCMPDAHKTPLHSWRGLMDLLAATATGRHSTEILLRVSSDLLAIGDRMAPSGQVLRESAEILVKALHADMYVCRLRDRKGDWRLHTANRIDGGCLPLLAPVLEEGLLRHPVMQAIGAGQSGYVLSNDLHSIERGGGSIDCMVYRAGYRSRLTFLLREHRNKHPFGLVMLFSQHEHGFAMYDSSFLTRCARIVSLTVGRRIAVTRDVLEKTAGAMAHYGNNILNIIRNQTEFCSELISSLDEVLTRAGTLADALDARLPAGTTERALADSVVTSLSYADLVKLSGNLGEIQEGSKRMTRLINALRKSAERPRLMHYALGRDVLALEPASTDEQE
ncbi:MAG: hypothetical protein PHN64_04225 [Desulfovibrionaceae bacterium]|nr:hypothetical protein [Desulfovibrionaceae bacterium]